MQKKIIRLNIGGGTQNIGGGCSSIKQEDDDEIRQEGWNEKPGI